MTAQPQAGVLTEMYRTRVGEPTTHDEVRGYWVFITGLVLGTAGFLLFLVSQSAAGAAGFTIREASIFLAAVGLAMLVAGPVIRLPLQSWANYAAYLGQTLCFLAAVWFIMVFPTDWSVQTGSQPVMILYGAGLAIITIGGVVVPLLGGVTEEDLKSSEARSSRLESKLEQAREATQSSEESVSDLEAELEAIKTSQARFELYEDAAEEWRWRLRHRNGNTIATSGEGYTRKHNAQKGMQSVRRNALGAETLLIESEADLPDPAEEFEPPEEADSQATYELYEDNAGEYRWRLRHRNDNLIADCSEGYANKGNLKRAVSRVRELVGPADYLQFDPTGFEVYQDAAGEWRWRLVHKNGNTLADSGEGYTRRNDATRAVKRIQERVAELDFEVFEDNAGDYRWRLEASNGEIVADSGEGYSARSEAENAVERVRTYAPEADVLEVGRAAFEVYEDNAREYRWRLRHRNGNILADSGEGYAERRNAHAGIESVKRNAPNADTDETDL